MDNFFKNLLNLHENISSDVWPNGGTLECRKCGEKREVTSKECGEYLKDGWPKCCGSTMCIE